MSDTGPENAHNSNSKANLIEVQHVGVTAKLSSPLRNLMPTSSSDTENGTIPIPYPPYKEVKYNKFTNDTQMESSSTTDTTSKVLYEMRAIREDKSVQKHGHRATPQKIEFQLYNKYSKQAHRSKAPKNKKFHRKLIDFDSKVKYNRKTNNECAAEELSILERLRRSFENMRNVQPEPTIDDIFDNLPEPPPMRAAPHTRDIPRETRIGIYPFEHGCADYLRTTDCHPQIVSFALAERATYFATRFWAEIFGSLFIGVSFVVTFILQTYRFLLYSLVNTLFVGLLHMTSDYLIKPLLTVIFNGFLQPPLIFIYNILTSVRDILEPVADTLNNFMKPIATVGKSLRLVNVSHHHHQHQNTEKEV